MELTRPTVKKAVQVKQCQFMCLNAKYFTCDGQMDYVYSKEVPMIRGDPERLKQV